MSPNCLSLHRDNGVPALFSGDTHRLPEGIRLEPGRYKVWLFRFVDDVSLQDELLQCLSADERVRAAAFMVPVARSHYVQTRAVLRMLLGGLLDQSPGDLIFDYGPFGKPSLRHGAAYGFNVAHSGDYALLGVAHGLELGVDIEQQRDIGDLAALARMVLSPDESRAWEGLSALDRPAALFSTWTAKEAVVKAMGRGLGLGLTTLDVGGLPDDASPKTRQVRAGESGSWRLTRLDAPAGYAAALAVSEHV